MGQKQIKKDGSKVQKILFIVGVILLSCIILSVFFRQKFLETRQQMLASCVSHETSQNHQHAEFFLYQDGTQIEIPGGIGLTPTCMHPVHTHDNSGTIHMEYPRRVHVTLGDFFAMQGILFSDTQVGPIKKSDGYRITVAVNGKVRKQWYAGTPLRDGDTITLRIASPKQ